MMVKGEVLYSAAGPGFLSESLSVIQNFNDRSRVRVRCVTVLQGWPSICTWFLLMFKMLLLLRFSQDESVSQNDG